MAIQAHLPKRMGWPTKGQEAFFCSKNSWEGRSHQFWFKWSWYIHMGPLQPITTQKVDVHAYRWLNWTICEAKLAAFLVIFMKWENLLLTKPWWFFFKSQIVLFQIISGALAEKVIFSFLQKSQVTFSTEAPEMIWETAREPRRAKIFCRFCTFW